MSKLLIADKSETFTKALCDMFADRFSIRCCADGRQVLDIVCQDKPDVMIMDLELMCMDGISVLRSLAASGHQVDTLVITSAAHSEYVMQSLIAVGVQYIMAKPCALIAVDDRVREILAMRSQTQPDIGDEAASLLLNLGLRNKQTGFQCVCEALRLLAFNPGKPLFKVLYPEVAEVCGGTGYSVERAIHRAIEAGFENRNESVWQLYFPPGRNGKFACPTNGQFLHRLVRAFAKEKIV